MLAQIPSGAGLTAGITVGALLAEEMLGSTDLAGVPSALFTAGAALGAVGIALVLLCLGWNFGLISGTAIVTDALPPDRRATTQGLVDVGIAVAGAVGSLASGLLVARTGYPTPALAVIPITGCSLRRRTRPTPNPSGPDRR
ncbi:hypothetical protein ACH4SP_23130 [Streptomyces sp. NPDC021093]|uniref:hypothetical protein n=1 Tax=Streptomyces sp. NPDC021093 TaxID=3365112 RepID=UPI00379B214A